MLKINLLYPIIISKVDTMILLESKDFMISVESEDLIKGVSRIKELIILKITEIAKENGNPPVPDMANVKTNDVIFIELDPTLFKYNCERVNMSIPKNLLNIIDLWGVNRSNYVSNLILQDILQKNDK
jgi:hypothetical protein